VVHKKQPEEGRSWSVCITWLWYCE